MNETTSTLLKVYTPALCFIGLSALIAQFTTISTYQLVADPAEVSHQPFYIGIFSKIGNLVWCATATICLFSALLLRSRQTLKEFRVIGLFLLFSGLLSVELLLDDLLQLHESVSMIFYGMNTLPKNIQNFTEMMVYVVYGLIFGTFLYSFKKIIVRSELLFFLLAILFFVLSTILDMMPDDLLGHNLLEEGCKLLGIVSWFAYFLRFCTSKLN